MEIHSLETLFRGDIICEKTSQEKLIVRQIENGCVKTTYRNSTRRGPEIPEENLNFYEKINDGVNDTEEYRKRIIKTYLCRSGNSQKAANKRYTEKYKGITFRFSEKEKEEILEFIKTSGKKKEEFLLELIREKKKQGDILNERKENI